MIDREENSSEWEKPDDMEALWAHLRTRPERVQEEDKAWMGEDLIAQKELEYKAWHEKLDELLRDSERIRDLGDQAEREKMLRREKMFEELPDDEKRRIRQIRFETPFRGKPARDQLNTLYKQLEDIESSIRAVREILLPVYSALKKDKVMVVAGSQSHQLKWSQLSPEQREEMQKVLDDGENGPILRSFIKGAHDQHIKKFLLMFAEEKRNGLLRLIEQEMAEATESSV